VPSEAAPKWISRQTLSASSRDIVRAYGEDNCLIYAISDTPEDASVLLPASQNLFEAILSEGVMVSLSVIYGAIPTMLVCSRMCKKFHDITGEVLYDAIVLKARPLALDRWIEPEYIEHRI